jgi:hypothetical protein
LTIVYKNKKNKELSVKVEISNAFKVKVSWNLNSNTDCNIRDVFPVIHGVSILRFIDLICSASELSCVVFDCLNQAKHWHSVNH